MKEVYNWKSLFAGMVIILVGIVLCIVSVYLTPTWGNVSLSIGCSLIASGLVILMHDFFVERKYISQVDEWKIDKIYSTRAEKNAESDPELTRVKYCLDTIAFGISSFRSKHASKVEELLRKGINVRMITMNPSSCFTNVRDKEEKKREGYTKYSIEQLINWADELNKKNFKGKIIVKGYDTMTLDFYWRIDDIIYIGPYWYGVDSQQTITYKFSAGGKGFVQYTEYFEKLWNDEILCIPLTQVKKVSNKKTKKKP